MKKIKFLFLLFFTPLLQSVHTDQTKNPTTTLCLNTFYKVHPLWFSSASIDQTKIQPHSKQTLASVISEYQNKAYENNQDYYKKLMNNKKTESFQVALREKILNSIYITEKLKEYLKKTSYISLEQLNFILNNRIMEKHIGEINSLAFKKFETIIKFKSFEFTDEECKRICLSIEK